MSWYVYIIECKDGKLYTGITNNLERRIRDHNSGSASRFTKYRAPVELLFKEHYKEYEKEVSNDHLPRLDGINLEIVKRRVLDRALWGFGRVKNSIFKKT